MGLDERARTPADIPIPELERLLSLVLARGGQFADLYLQHHRTSSLLLEEGIIRTASAGVTCGLGVRVVSGERTGYAYTDDLSWPAMARAAETAAHIASDSKTLPPQPVSPAPVERRYGESTVGVLGLSERIALVERADRAARAYDPRIEKVIVSLSDETKQVRIANSAGVLVEDVQPLFSIRVSAIAAEKGLRREGSAGGGGRMGPEFFDAKPPESFAREAARMAVTLLGAVEAPAGAMPVVLGPGWPGILLHEAVGHGLEGDFNRKGTSAFSGRIGQRVAARGVTVVDITSSRMLMAHGFLRRLFEVFERFKTSVDVVTTSEVSVSVTVDNPRRLDDIMSNLRNFAEVSRESDMAIVCAVGENLRADPTLFARAVTALDRIPLRLVSQAAARRNITFVLRDADAPEAMKRLHAAFFGS